MSVPKLRFKEFDGAWAITPLKNISKIYDGTHQTPNYVEKGVPFYSVEHVTANNFSNTKFIADDVYQAEIKRVKLEKGDILLTRIGDIGTTRLIDWDVFASFYVSLALLKISQENHSSFVNQYIKSPFFQRELHERTIHVAFPKKINLGEIGLCVIKIPVLEEQTKIASFLSAVDEKISQLTQKHQLLSQYKQGMMQKLFSQQIRFKSDDGSEFGAWEEKKLGEIGIFLKGKGISKADIVDDGKLPCIRYGELYTRYKEIISHVFSATNLDSKNLVLSKANDVLIPASGETQVDIATASCVLEDNIALSGDLNIYRTKENGIFLSYLIRSHLKMQIVQLAQGNSVVHLYSSQLKGVQLNLPCLEEQTKIANFLSAIDQKIDVVAQQIQQTKTWKKGLLQQMFV